MPHTLHLSETHYQVLVRQADRLGLTPEQMLERLLASDIAARLDRPDIKEETSPPTDTAAALAAVERLTSLFADLTHPDLDAIVDDPLLALANADLGAERR